MEQPAKKNVDDNIISRNIFFMIHSLRQLAGYYDQVNRSILRNEQIQRHGDANEKELVIKRKQPHSPRCR